MTALVVAALVPMIAEGDDDKIQEAGDFTQILVPTAAGLMSLAVADYQGTLQFAKSLAAATATTHITKNIVEKTRPDQTENNSFPSGHTQGAFSGAGFINRRYGARFGVPAYLLATFTGASRVSSNKHYGDDVLSGASVAMFANWFFVHPVRVAGAAVSPIVNNEMVGVSIDLLPPPEAPATTEDDFDPSLRYELLFGPASMIRNEYSSPPNRSTALSITDFSDTAEPQVVAMGNLEWFFAERSELDFRWFPYEIRDSGTFSKNTTFGGQNFAQGDPGESAFVMYDYRFRYRYRLLPDPWDVRAGVGVVVRDLSETIRSGAVTASAGTVFASALLHGRVGYRVARHWVALVESDVSIESSAHGFDATAQLRYEASKHWDFTAGYRYMRHHASDDEYRYDLDLSMLQLGIGYTM